jgi:hypothetical protein
MCYMRAVQETISIGTVEISSYIQRHGREMSFG